MEKIYHVFVSSTFIDLIEVRKDVSQSLSKAGFVPEGMELFPASSQKQMDFIQSVIDRCDYYVLILAGRYGSLDDDGKSYTEKEFEYATKQGIPVLGFLYKDLEDLAGKYIDDDKTEITRFREHLRKNSIIDYWDNKHDVAKLVLAALTQESLKNPRSGWIRGDKAASEKLVDEINVLREENTSLKNQIKEISNIKKTDLNFKFGDLDIANMTEEFEFILNFKSALQSRYRHSTHKLNWQNIFLVVAPNYLGFQSISIIPKLLADKFDIHYSEFESITLEKSADYTIVVQLETLGLLEKRVTTNKVLYKLSQMGYNYFKSSILVQTRVNNK